MRVRFDIGAITVRGELTEEGAAWIWQLLAGRLRNEQGGLSDHLGKSRLVAGDGAPVRDQPRLVGEHTTYGELAAHYPQLHGPRATFRASIAADFPVREVGLTSIQSVLIARSSVRFEAPPGRHVVTAVLELAPNYGPVPRNLALLALM